MDFHYLVWNKGNLFILKTAKMWRWLCHMCTNAPLPLWQSQRSCTNPFSHPNVSSRTPVQQSRLIIPKNSTDLQKTVYVVLCLQPPIKTLDFTFLLKPMPCCCDITKGVFPILLLLIQTFWNVEQTKERQLFVISGDFIERLQTDYCWGTLLKWFFSTKTSTVSVCLNLFLWYLQVLDFISFLIWH